MKHFGVHHTGRTHSTRRPFVPRPVAAAVASAFLSVSTVWAQLPSGAAVVNGSAGIVTNGAQMTITNSPNAILNWQSFSIGATNGVRFDQQSASSQVLNRVVGNDPSSIFGSLTSNGRVWLVNPHGVLFGKDARVDVGGLVASTLGVTNSDFLANRFRFEGLDGTSAARVLNQGEINTSFGGRVWLMGDAVANEGLIKTPGGSIVLAAGKSIEVVDSGLPNVVVRVTAPANEAINLGSLIASSGGSIDLHGGIVNQQAIVRADSVGTDAAGRVVIKAQGDVRLGDASTTSASSVGAGRAGSVTVESAAGTTTASGQVLAASTQGAGGHVQLLGKNVGLIREALADASGATGGGEVLVGGDYQGKNPAVSNAAATYLGAGATVKVNATDSGNGGKVIVWGNDAARVYGTIEARGRGNGGGGFVETSGHYLDATPRSIDVGSERGAAGQWLIDPFNILIVNPLSVDSDTNITLAPNFTSTGGDSRLLTSTVNSALDNGGLVRIFTSGPAAGQGNITVAGDIVTSGSGARLEMTAHGDIVLQAGRTIRSNAGPLAVSLTSDSDQNGAGGIYLQQGSSISTANGNVSLQAGGNASQTNASLVVEGATINAGLGALALTGRGGAASLGVLIRDGLASGARSTLDASTIDINGQGGGTGVYIINSDLTATGNILVEGQAAVTTNPSVYLAGGTTLSAGLNMILRGNGPLSRVQIGETSSSNPVLVATEGGQGTELGIFADRVVNEANGSIRADGGGLLRITANSLSSAGEILSDGSGTSILITAGSADIAELDAPNGRWLVFTRNPGTINADQLLPDFLQHNTAVAGSAPAGSGDGILYDDPLLINYNITRAYDGTNVAPVIFGQPGNILTAAANYFISQPLGTNTGQFADKNVGIGKPISNFSAPIDVGYNQFALNRSIPVFGASLSVTGTITPLPITASGVTAANKVYDGTAVATLTGGTLGQVLPGDAVTLTGATGTFDNKNAGNAKTVTVAGGTLGGVDGGNYQLSGTSSTTADITPKPASVAITGTVAKSYDGTTAATLSATQYTLNGLVAGDAVSVSGPTQGNYDSPAAGTGKLVTTTGPLQISGADANNYSIAVGSATGNVGTITPAPVSSANGPAQQAALSSESSIAAATASTIAALGQRGAGGVFDAAASSGAGAFRPVNIGGMSQDELLRLLESRKDFKRKLFADAVYKLEIDPSLADVRLCVSAAEGASGLCRNTPGQIAELHAKSVKALPGQRTATKKALPQIERKIGVFFGINDYADKRIPKLENALPDVDAVSKVFAERLGYEVKVVRNPTKADIIRTLNELAAQVNPADSVVVYYAGHGYSVDKSAEGYWLPSDAPVNDPGRWISNNDVARLLAGVQSRQMALITDSCYAGAFAREGMASVGRGVNADDVLTKRSVVVLSSGGDEPVSDEGKEGHSIFAWSLMKSLGSVQNWNQGSNVFEEVQTAVKKEFPQTPKYGSVTSAGHQPGGDYLFEQR